MNQELIEKEFLSILILEPKIGFDLLQIQPKFLTDKRNQQILAIAIKLKKDNIFVDKPQIIASLGNDNKLLDYVIDIISDENIPITNIRQQFVSSQITILDNFKKKCVEFWTKELSNNKITYDEYSHKISSLNTIVIKDETTILDEKELLENIKIEKTSISLNSFKKLNETLRLVQGDFLMIGASTGVGKSGLLLNLMNELMNNYQCIYFNMEMSKSTIYKRMISIKSNIPVQDIEYPKSKLQEEKIGQAIKEITEHKVIVEHKASYINEIRAVLGKHKDDKKHTIIFLDHVGLIKNSNKKSIYEQTTEVAKQLRQFCLDYDCTIISACQLNRASYNANELSLSMLKDSGELENSSSKVVLLYKNSKQNQYNAKYIDDMVLEVVKNRDGRLGKIPFSYDKTKQIFKEIENYYEND